MTTGLGELGRDLLRGRRRLFETLFLDVVMGGMGESVGVHREDYENESLVGLLFVSVNL